MARRGYTRGIEVSGGAALVLLAVNLVILVWSIYVGLMILNHVDAWPVNGWLGD